MASIIVIDNLLIANIQLQILEAYYDLAEVFNPNKTQELPPYYKNNLIINIKPRAQLLLKPIYKIFKLKKEIFYKYI